MKALTICQPYAHLIRIGEKRVENRTWDTRYRGPLAIHAGKSRAWLRPHDNPDDYVYGAVIAVAQLFDCIDYALECDYTARNGTGHYYGWVPDHPHATGPYCLMLRDVRPLPEPIPATGRQGLWNWRAPHAMPTCCSK